MTVVSRESLREQARGISVGLFAAPLGALADAAREIAGWGARIAHFDVMDGVFVPAITAGPGFVSALDDALGDSLGDGMLRDVHLMVADPAAQVDTFARAGADIITIHAEAPSAKQALDAVRAASDRLGRSILAGLAIMPGTPLESLAPLLDPMPDLILVLALDPRDGAPADLVKAGERLRTLDEMVAPHRPLMAIDGGVTLDTIAAAAAQGPDMIVSGSAIFRAPDPAEAFRSLNQTWADRARPFATAETENA